MPNRPFMPESVSTIMPWGDTHRQRPGEDAEMRPTSNETVEKEARAAFNTALDSPAAGEDFTVTLSSVQAKRLAGFLKSVDAAYDATKE